MYVAGYISKFYCTILFYLNGVEHKSFKVLGYPNVHVSLGASCIIRSGFVMNNGVKYSDSGINGKCRIHVRDKGELIIDENVGISDVTITCHEKILIGKNVLIGVGSQLRDTDNHSLNPNDRLVGKDWVNKKTAPIKIGDNVFIGANVFVLKGVEIGRNSIVGAGSVVSRDIPENEIWAGNPARFIKKVSF